MLLLNGIGSATLCKKKFLQSCFPLNFANFFKNIFFTEQDRTTTSESSPVRSIFRIRPRATVNKF